MKTVVMFMLCVGWWPIFCVWLLRKHNEALQEVFGEDTWCDGCKKFSRGTICPYC